VCCGCRASSPLVENWVVYRRLPEAIEHHRWGDKLGKNAWAVARFLEKQTAGFGGRSASLPAGMVPVFAKFFGLRSTSPRHVVVGILTFALSSSTSTRSAGARGVRVVRHRDASAAQLRRQLALALVVALRAGMSAANVALPGGRPPVLPQAARVLLSPKDTGPRRNDRHH